RRNYAGNEITGSEEQDADGSDRLRRISRSGERQHHAQAGADVRDSEEAFDTGYRDCRRGCRGGAAGWLRLPALGVGELPARPGRYLYFPIADPPLFAENRRYGRGTDP